MLTMLEPSPQHIQEEKLYQTMGLKDSEFDLVVKTLGRLPNYTELGLFSVMWSEHCSYKHSKKALRAFPTTGERVLQGPGEGAGVVDIGDNQAVVFKMESHNHPSAIEPYQGAATGVGGIIRDVFSMGARPIALLNSLRFGELEDAAVRQTMKGVVAGIAGYGNCIGIPTVGGEVQFDATYKGNPLVNAMCVGLIDHDKVQKGVAKGIGNTVMYVGAKTGRDGIHGATFASDELNESSEAKRPSVQVGDPFMEKLVMEACLEAITLPGLVGIQDMGAAGLTSSSAEMASKAGTGIEMNLDFVPQREEGMTAYEMMLSESQERMLLVVEKGMEQPFYDLFKRYALDAVAVGTVIEEKVLRLTHHGEVVAEAPVDALAEEAPVYSPKTAVPTYFEEAGDVTIEVEQPEVMLETLLQQPTIASKEWVYSQYDTQVRTNTVVTPGSDAAVVRIRGTKKALAMTTDCNSRYVYVDPFVGGQLTIAEAARNLVCSGAQPLAVTDCLNFGSPEKPEIFWQFQQAINGMADSCSALSTPVISGNVSLYNETNGQAIYPTPIVGMVGLIEDIANVTTQQVKEAGDAVYLVGEIGHDYGASEVQKVLHGETSGKAPAFSIEKEKNVQEAVLSGIQAGLITAAHDIAEGGIAVALSEMCFGTEGLGMDVEMTLSKEQLFSETPSCIIVTVKPEQEEAFLQDYAHLVTKLGMVTADEKLTISIKDGETAIQTPVQKLEEAWRGAIACYLN